MTRQTKLATLLSVSSALIISGIAQAQAPAVPPPAPMPDPAAAPGAPGMPGAPGGGSSSSSGLGTVSNDSLDSTSSTTTTTTTTGLDGDTDTLPNTGGEPLLMSLMGSLVAGSALLLRRKIS